MAAEIKGNILKVKSSHQNREDYSSSKEKGVLSPKNNNNYNKRLIESSSNKNKLILNSQHKSVPNLSKSEVKEKTISISSKTITKTVTVKGKKTEKKVYTLAGQKYDPPEEREPLRIFYESLSKQIPSSEMAEFWMMEHGLLSPERSKRAYERKQKRQQQLRMGTPIKSSKTDRPESSQRQQSWKNGDLKAKKRMSYSDDDDDFIQKPKKR
ncbi:uncharacterized protein LOC131257759 [Magnolia sinica]|uniref:uncharacterized protein LOC131257759 n=1 Tax=Magnolia sinica TaxID=86752 RepID=UPI00265AD68F|nr:uncharacterized protein LOC131257759 [Magnolia sinica]